MDSATTWVLAGLFFAGAVLYSAVGHAGGSAYLAAMGLVGVEALIMKPTSLSLNVLAASIATFKYWRARCFSWSLFWPFAVTSVPAAFLGGAIDLQGIYYRPLVGLALVVAGFWMVWPPKAARNRPIQRPDLTTALMIGAGIGLVAGLTGTGGGIYLSPILVLMNWAELRQVSGTTAPIILVNSIAALAGKLSSLGKVPHEIAIWLPVAALGALIGSHLGATRFKNDTIRRLLGGVLWIAGGKLLLFPNG